MEEKATKGFSEEFTEGFYGLGGPFASLNRQEAKQVGWNWSRVEITLFSRRELWLAQ